jgi:hypothetical protein
MDTLRRALARPSLRSAGWAFLVSRALILALILVGPVPSHHPPWPGLRNEGLAPGAGPALSELAMRGDGEWYIGIAERGYEAIAFDVARQHNWAFFPLMPLLLRAAGGVTGEMRVTGMALSTGLLLLALLVLHELALALGLDEASARRAVLYTALWPTSVFFSLPTTESLFLLLCVVSGWGAATGRMGWAGLAGALASATRPNGLLLLPLLVLRNFQLLNFAAALVGLGAVAFWARRGRWALAAYGLLCLFVPLSTQSIQSLARFMMVTFPVCLMLGLLGGRERVHEGLLVVLTSLFIVVTLGLVVGYTFALT